MTMQRYEQNIVALALAVLCSIGVPFTAKSAEEVPNQLARSDSSLCENDKTPAEAKIAACTRFIDSGPQDNNRLARAYSNRGTGFAVKRDLDHAMADFDRAIDLDASIAAVHYNRGNVWSTKGELERAIADFSQAIRLEPKFFQAHMARAAAYLRRKDFNSALQDADQLVTYEPRSPVASDARAYILALLGRRDEAITEYRRALPLAADIPQLQADIASKLKQLGVKD